MSIFLWYLGALIVSLIFPPTAIFVFGFAILKHWGINEGKKEKFRKELQQQDWDRIDYEHEKWNNPLSSKTKQKNTSLEHTVSGRFMAKHDDFLISQIKWVEESFREHGSNLFREETFGELSAHLDPEKLGGNGEKIAYQLMKTPGKYIRLCRSVNRKPVPELLEVWGSMITQGNRTREAFKNLKDQHKQDEEEFARNLKQMIIARLSQGDDWRPVLADAKIQISRSNHTTLKVWREHGDWTIKAFRTVSENQFELRF